MADSVLNIEKDSQELRSMIGVPLPVESGWTPVASQTAIRHFALAMGDTNPLWMDPAYGRDSRFGSQIAPPYFVQATEGIHVGGFMVNYTGLYLGATARFYEPVPAGTRISTRSRLTDVEERKTAAGQPMTLLHQQMDYLDDDEHLLASVSHIVARLLPASESGPDPDGEAPAAAPACSPGQADAIRAAQQGYQRRGGTRRLIEDVSPGDTIGPLVYGPLTTLDFCAKFVQLGQRNASTLDMARAHAQGRSSGIPAPFLPDATGFLAYPGRGHLDERLARARGMAGPFDYGQVRQMWASRLFTDWAGDDGWLAELTVQIRRPVFAGETLTFSAEVTEKLTHQGKPAVRASLLVTDAGGGMKSKGTAIMTLPSSSSAD